jgi:hypothetical protein
MFLATAPRKLACLDAAVGAATVAGSLQRLHVRPPELALGVALRTI